MAGIAGHLRAVAAYGFACGRIGGAVAEAVFPRGDDDAGGQPLDVPIERRGECLVEVVDVEDQTPVRCGVHAEIQ